MLPNGSSPVQFDFEEEEWRDWLDLYEVLAYEEAAYYEAGTGAPIYVSSVDTDH